ncbi:Hypothetical predicted protein [Octopus vulgaris]|uniref:Centromere protein L n=3 Tax=Octopus TaxID=6643 RepID=A0AA36ARK7_OCTVU|nr:Hypothetical predicted protein [Octopus vulgaris]
MFIDLDTRYVTFFFLERNFSKMSVPPQFHTKTPVTRKLPNKIKSADKAVGPPQIPALKNICHLFKLSPILNFETTPAKFKIYATSLTSYCQSKTKEIHSVSVSSCNFTTLEGFKVSETDKDAVQLTMYTKNGTRNKMILLALMCCVDLPPHFAALEKSFSCYPVMVIRGSSMLKSWTCEWFEKEFHAKISPLHFSSIDLSWMLSLWTGKINFDLSSPTYLVFQVPDEIKGMNEVKISIDTKDLQYVWDKIHPDPNDSEFTIDQVNEFISQIELFYYEVLKLKITSLKLIKIRNALASVSVNGVFKLCSSNHLVHILRLFCQMSVEQLSFIYTI